MRLIPLAVLALPVLSLTACGSGVGANDKEICQTSKQVGAVFREEHGAGLFGTSDEVRVKSRTEYAATLETQAAASGDDLADGLMAVREQMLKMAADHDAYDPSAVQAAYDELYTACEAAGAPWGVK